MEGVLSQKFDASRKGFCVVFPCVFMLCHVEFKKINPRIELKACLHYISCLTFQILYATKRQEENIEKRNFTGIFNIVYLFYSFAFVLEVSILS